MTQHFHAFFLSALLFAAAPLYAQRQDFTGGWTFWSDSRPQKEAIRLPHDAMLTENRSADNPGGFGNAYFAGGVYHYEKTFTVPSEWSQKHISLLFEGVYKDAKVLVNGTEAAFHAYGFTPFEVCLDGLLHTGENTVRVDVDNALTPNIRWYSGAGIYRPVWLDVCNQTHLSSVKVSTLSTDSARIAVETTHNGQNVKVRISYKGKPVAQAEGSSRLELDIPEAKLWSAEHPDLYTATVQLYKGGELQDEETVEFGIRRLEWGPEGFCVNGETVLLAGTCVHHDNGIMGAVEHDDAAMRRVRILKSFGFNAVRSAHNPMSEAMLRACDRLGMYVMDELWDGWTDRKMEYDYHLDFLSHYEEDIEAMVSKDFNHPSVVMYSIGNELSEPARPEGMELGRRIVAKVHSLDVSRPVTCGVNLSILADAGRQYQKGAASQAETNMELLIALLMKPMDPSVSSLQFNESVALSGDTSNETLRTAEVDSLVSPFLDLLDIAGYNYGHARYDLDGALHQERVIVGSETYPARMYDNWLDVKKWPYVIGDFMWTGWDYLGETGAGAWRYGSSARFAQPYPWLLGDFGAIDILGNPGGEAFLAKTIFREEKQPPYICVRPVREDVPFKSSWRCTNAIPSWSWRGCEGIMATVEVYTNAPEAELLLSGRTLGRAKTVKNVATFTIPYAKGTLEARAIYPDAVLSSRLKSADNKLRIKLSSEGKNHHAGDLIYVNVDLADGHGVTESMADRELRVDVEGAELLGFGSALSAPDGYSFRDGVYPTHYGKAQIVLRATQKGNVRLKVSSEGLPSRSIRIGVR